MVVVPWKCAPCASVRKVGLEEERRTGWRDAVQEDLDEVGSVMLGAELLAAGDERFADRLVAEDLIVDEQARHDPGIELSSRPGRAQRAEGLERDGRILEGGHTEGAQKLDTTP